jgi:DNA polymerase-1
LYPYVRNDLKIAGEASLGIEPKREEYTQILDPTLGQSIEYVERCKDAKSTVVDIETGYRKIRCVGLSCDNRSGIAIPFRHQGFQNRWSYTEHCILLNKLRELWESPTVKIAHNAEYDFLWLYPLLGMPREPIFDTMRAHALVYPESPHDLGFVMSTHTNLPYHKDEGKGVTSDEELWSYNVKDCVGTYICYEKLVEELHEIDMYEFFVGYTMPFFRLTLEMERVGIRVDREMFEKRRETTKRKADGLQRAINRAVGREVNVNSPKAIGELLYDEWGLPEQRNFKTKKRSVDREALDFLYARYPNRIFRIRGI